MTVVLIVPRSRPAPRPLPRPSRGLLLLAGALLLAVAPAASAGDEPFFLYGMNQRGKLSVGGTLLESLPGKFKPGDENDPNGEHRWTDLAVSGKDRWALRLDGRLQKNGVKAATFPFDGDPGALWLRLAVTDGIAHALRTDGLIHSEDGQVAFYPKGTSFFADLVAVPSQGEGAEPDVFAMRFDGLIFTAGSATPAGRFQAGEGLGGGQGPTPTDGSHTHTVWVRMVVDPVSGNLVGLRADGKVHTISIADLDLPGEGGTPVGTELVALPFPDMAAQLGNDDLYVDIDFAPDGTYFVIAADGRIYSTDDPNDALVDLPGSGQTEDEVFVDVLAFGGLLHALRFDGRVFRGVDPTPLVVLPNKRYVRLAASDTPPDLESFDNRLPVASVFKTRLVEGEPATIPIIVTDVDKLASELEIEADFEKLPGGMLDLGAVPPHVTVPGDLPPGKHRFTISVDDGVAKKAKVFKFPVKVVPADTDPDKNKKPMPAKVKKVQALVGFELLVPLVATDPDGDRLTITAVEGKGVFEQGALFDEATATLSWTPAFEHVGKTAAQFLVSDGLKTKKLKLKIDVVNPLIF